MPLFLLQKLPKTDEHDCRALMSYIHALNGKEITTRSSLIYIIDLSEKDICHVCADSASKSCGSVSSVDFQQPLLEPDLGLDGLFVHHRPLCLD